MGMSNELPSKCPECGALVKESAPAGLCPGCLMALNLKTETVFTDDTPAAQPPLPPNKSPRIFHSSKSSNASDAAAWAWFTRRGRKA